MTPMQDLAEVIRSQSAAIEDLKRRVASLVMIGQAVEVQGDKVRLEFDARDPATGAPFRGPLTRRASAAGAGGSGHKERNRPAVGETMVLISPNGEIGAHSRALPYGPTDESAEPGEDAGYPRVFAEGNASMAIKAGEIRLKVGGVTVTLTAEGLRVTGGRVEHDGRNIGTDHVHGGIVKGGDLTDVPAN